MSQFAAHISTELISPKILFFFFFCLISGRGSDNERVFWAVKILKVTDLTWYLVQIWKNPIQMKKSGAATIELLQRFYLQKYSKCTYTRIACLSTDMIFAKKKYLKNTSSSSLT